MNKRIFISISLPERIKNKLASLQDEIAQSFTSFNDFCPVKWTKKSNLHITLFFIGYVEIDELPAVFDIIEEIAEKQGSFNIDLKSVSYGPPGKPPKMVWANGEKSEELNKLQVELEKKLLDIKEPENGFTPHITLGRIIQWQFNRIEPEERPDTYREVSLSFPVNSIEVMESNLKGGGSQYTVLRSFPLK